MKKSFFKKAAAVFAAAGIGISAFPLSALAAEGYKEIVQEAVDAAADSILATYDETLAAVASAEELTTDSTITVSLGDGGKAMLGLTGLDLSWLSGVSIKETAVFEDGKLYAPIELAVNDTPVIHAELLMDLANNSIYINVPEFSDAWLMVDMTSAFAESGMSPQELQAFMALYSEIMKHPEKYCPTGKEISTIVGRYGKLLTDNIEDGAAVEDSIIAGGVSEDCTVYEGTMTVQGLFDTVKNLLPAAIGDQEIKSILDRFSEMLGGAAAGVDLHTEFVNQLQEISDSMLSAPDAETAAFQCLDSSIFQNANGKCIGWEMTFDDEYSQTVFAVATPQNGNEEGLYLEFAFDEYDVVLEGSGTMEDGMFSGSYVFSVNDMGFVTMHVDDMYADESGESQGVLTFSVMVPQIEEGSDEYYEMEEVIGTLQALSPYQLQLSFMTEAETSASYVAATVLSNTVELGTITMGTVPSAEPLTVKPVTSLGTIYDIEDENELSNYLMNMDFETIFTNLMNAGVPEEFLSMILDEMGMGGSGEEVEATHDSHDTVQSAA